MRDLKTLLELLLENWELNENNNNQNNYSGLCSVVYGMELRREITNDESCLIKKYIDGFTPYWSPYLFHTFLHNERVEWLKERIAEI